jgi:hypothetical protein
MATKNAMTMRTLTNEDEARRLMVSRNRTRADRTDIAVMVDGPNDGEFTVMDLRDAVENGFMYTWEV